MTTKADDARTPMLEQYFGIKALHKGALLLFRMGDFYELFYEDAVAASPALEIALTSRNGIPMCGFPHHAAGSYIPRLLRRGFKAAICEQVEDPRTAKGIVKREVIKVLTPGTAVEMDGEDVAEGQTVAALCLRDGGWGLALVDLAAGEIRVLDGGPGEGRALADELFLSAPREIVYPEGDEDAVRAALPPESRTAAGPVEAWAFDPARARHLLETHFGVQSLDGFDLGGRPLAVAAAGALLHYVRGVRKDSLSLVRRLTSVRRENRCILDAVTVRNLELVRDLREGRPEAALLGVIDCTLTGPGGRLLRSWLLKPLLDPAEIDSRLDAVEDGLRRTIERGGIRDRLKGIQDLERLTGRVALGAASPRDLVALKTSLRALPAVRPRLEALSAPLFRELADGWDDGADLTALIDRAILEEPAAALTEGGLIKDGFDAGLDELREASRSGKGFIVDLERRERERTGIASLKVKFNKVFGYSIEVTRPNLHLVPPEYVRRQTLAGGERFLTPELKDCEDKVLHAEERIKALEQRLFLETREAVARETPRLQAIARAVALLDVLLGLAECAARRGYRRPRVDDGDALIIDGGRHPVIEASRAEPFIPNDARLDAGENQILVITGPNMGGKSTYLRQVALIVILAQMGSFVPADAAVIGIVDRVFTRIGALDFLSAGQSTFMVEMLETAAILNSAGPRSLVLLDEVGRGTSTFDGLSLAWAVAEHLHERAAGRPRTLFATHYHELTELALTLPRVQNCHVSVREWQGEVTFLRKIVPGPTDRSYGIHVAELAGIPPEVIARAREILLNLENQAVDADGTPRIAYHRIRPRDPGQLWLFGEDRAAAALEEVRSELEACAVDSLTPFEALKLLGRWKDLLAAGGGGGQKSSSFSASPPSRSSASPASSSPASTSSAVPSSSSSAAASSSPKSRSSSS